MILIDRGPASPFFERHLYKHMKADLEKHFAINNLRKHLQILCQLYDRFKTTWFPLVNETKSRRGIHNAPGGDCELRYCTISYFCA